MSHCKKNYCDKSYKIHPLCPLKLMRYTVVSCGDIKEVLSLVGSPQEIRFTNLLYLAGRAISLIVPRYIHDNCGQLYKICVVEDIIVVDINNNTLNVVTVLSQDNTKYYISIPVTEDTFYDCELILQFVNLTLNLEKIEMCEVEDVTQRTCQTDSQSCESNQNDNQSDSNSDNNRSNSRSCTPIMHSIPLTSCTDSWNWIPSVIDDKWCS